MIGVVGHHLSIGTGISACKAAKIAAELGATAFEISAIPRSVASGFAKEIGYDYVKAEDVIDVQVDVNASPADCEQVRSSVEEAGVKICALGGYNDFALPNEELQAEKERIVKSCRAAKALGTDIIRVFGGDFKEGMDRKAEIKKIVGCFKDIMPEAEKSGIYLAIENHLHLVNDAETLLEIIDSVESDNLKVTLDFANFYWLNADVRKTESMIHRIAPHVVHTHFKNVICEDGKCSFTSLGQGDLNIDMVIDTLLEAGYSRPYCVACESEDFSNLDAVRTGFARSIEYLADLLDTR